MSWRKIAGPKLLMVPLSLGGARPTGYLASSRSRSHWRCTLGRTVPGSSSCFRQTQQTSARAACQTSSESHPLWGCLGRKRVVNSVPERKLSFAGPRQQRVSGKQPNRLRPTFKKFFFWETASLSSSDDWRIIPILVPHEMFSLGTSLLFHQNPHAVDPHAP